mmetsp:Transcript_72616/g.130781  ORF Transcript_72616/g.130781 Transcript_72616/m.130781 type:complete len:211 (-) Transcript_72616:163-795(-)
MCWICVCTEPRRKIRSSTMDRASDCGSSPRRDSAVLRRFSKSSSRRREELSAAPVPSSGTAALWGAFETTSCRPSSRFSSRSCRARRSKSFFRLRSSWMPMPFRRPDSLRLLPEELLEEMPLESLEPEEEAVPLWAWGARAGPNPTAFRLLLLLSVAGSSPASFAASPPPSSGSEALRWRGARWLTAAGASNFLRSLLTSSFRFLATWAR